MQEQAMEEDDKLQKTKPKFCFMSGNL